LETVSELYQIIIFTAGNKNYADTILNYLDPTGKYLSIRYYREHCVMNKNGLMVKDLSIFSNIQGDYFIVDNSISSFMN